MKLKRPDKKMGLICLLAGVTVVAAVILFVFVGWQPFAGQAKTSNPPFKLSVWVTYWDWEKGLKDLDAISPMPDSVQAFAASFDASDKLFFPEGMTDLIAKLKALKAANPNLPVYLSIVNDSLGADGKWTDKDSSLMDRLMQSDESRASHVAEIMDMTDKNGFSGVEIDYEKISGQSWQGFYDFCSSLYTGLQEKGKKMRVVLEPGAPLTQARLPVGPEYVMMAYNLYGDSTKPGPKADNAFIRKLAAKMNAIEGSKSIAFATGGYDWDSDGSAVEVTETEAYNLSQKSQGVQRDSGSGGLHFNYQKDGGTHTVWYADQQTLKGWFDLSRSLGIGDIAVWKMGEERQETLQMLGELRASN